MASPHPYSSAPAKAFWSRSVSAGWNARDLVTGYGPVLRSADRIMSAGSCFAANIIPFLEESGFTYVRTETIDDTASDKFGYSRYSASYGNIYTARQFLQLVRRVQGKFRPAEDRWHEDDVVIDPFRPGLPYPAESNEEFDALTASHLSRTGEAIATATVLIFTLGLTEAWTSSIDGAVFPACPGTVAGSFDPTKHSFRNFGVTEVSQDLSEVANELRSINPNLRIVLTVSPVPLVATATDRHVLCASTYSKSVLRVACEQAVREHSSIVYFPAYEIITGPQAPDYFEPDRRNVSRAGIDAVMDALRASSETPKAATMSGAQQGCVTSAGQLSKMLARFECEEMMADPDLARESEIPSRRL